MVTTTKQQPLTLVQHLIYSCSRFLAYGLPLLFFLVTTSFYLKTYDSAQVKITFTQIGAAILFFVWVTKILLEGRFPFKKNDMVFVAPFFAFLLSGLIAYAHTPFKAWSLEETVRRVIYMVLALIAIDEFRSDERMKRLWRWLLAAAWVSIGYGVLQYVDSRFFAAPSTGIDPFIWRQAFGPRVFSTFGNPNFYGNFLVIVTPLILASILRAQGSLSRPFVILGLILGIFICVDKMNLGLFGGYDPAYGAVFGFLLIALLIGFWVSCVWKVGTTSGLPFFLILFAILFLNLYATETKGAWLGFIAAMAGTLWLITEYFLHLEDRTIEDKKYVAFAFSLIVLFGLLISLMIFAFVIPLFKGTVQQIGFSILWIPTLIATILSVMTGLWVMKKPWNLKKVVYGSLVFFVLFMGAGVLQFAKTRLLSVSFRLFTWISTWEMIRTEPVLGNGIGTFKVIYPAYRRPHIIVLEGKSNTETDHSEDEYLEVWQDEGIVGFGIFLWLVITALTCGLKQLRWYSKLRVPDAAGKRNLLDVKGDPRSYDVLGLLGAYIGALFHWTVDVSIRFVSSGVFSGILPGLLVAYARNHDNPVRHEVRLSYDRWIRVAVAASWTIVILALRMELVPQSFIPNGDTSDTQIFFFGLLAGVFLYILLELLEIGNKPEKDVPFSEQYPTVNNSFIQLRFAGIIVVAVLVFKGTQVFAGYFQADVNHNLAIFFSKNAIWTKEPRYEGKLQNLPPDIKDQYNEVGGALEHYETVHKLNPAFPMALYFTGNVYNDRGSEYIGMALQARAQGNKVDEERLRAKAMQMWDSSEKAYADTKSLAPNYVQTHHQVGLLYVKRAEAANQWGDAALANEYYDKALKNFNLYRELDPVFPPNYDRIVQILVMRNQFEEAEKLYDECYYYNTVVAKSINKTGFPERAAEVAVNAAKLYFTHANKLSANPFHPPLPQVLSALKYFELATQDNPRSLDAWKGIGFVKTRMGDQAGAQVALKKAFEINPNDPDLRSGNPHP